MRQYLAFVVFTSSLFVSACGGGSSSSDADKELDGYIDQQLVEFCRSLSAEELAENESCQKVLSDNA